MYDETRRAGHATAVSSHVDQRSTRQKLKDLADHPRTPPEEAAAARRALAALPAPKTLSRVDILSAPDLRPSVAPRRVWSPYFRAWVIVDPDDPLYAGLFEERMAYDEDWDGE